MSIDPKTCSLVIASHGSLAAPDSNQPIYDLVDAISGREIFAKVIPAFLNGEPLMTDFMQHLPDHNAAPNVVVVPAMTSVGYYLQSVIPKQIAENQNHADYQILMAPVVGMHPSIADLICQRIDDTLAENQMERDQTTVVLVGHGTRRNANSCRSTYDLLDQLKQRMPRQSFEIAFLDQDPEAADVAQSVTTPNTIVVPFLISRGPHTTVDIPEAFGLPAGPDVQFPNRSVGPVAAGKQKICVCDLPIGMYPQFADLCVEIAEKTLANGVPIELPLGSMTLASDTRT